MTTTAPSFATRPTARTRDAGLSSVFRVELRRRHDDAAPVERVDLRARTIANARHAARLMYPGTVIVSVTRASPRG